MYPVSYSAISPYLMAAVGVRTTMVLAGTVSAALLALTGQEHVPLDAASQLLAYVYAYDARGGGVETTFKGDKQGLGLTKRSKKRFAAQQLTTLLGSLAHNVIVWARGWMGEQQPKLAQYGMLRMVRDVFHIQGWIELDAQGHVVRIILNQAAPLVRGIGARLRMLLAPTHIAVTSSET